MSKKNDATPFVRQCVALWVAGVGSVSFSVANVVNGLHEAHPSLDDIDVSKAVSNELVRLEHVGKLTSHVGSVEDGCGMGRPPRVYVKRYCMSSIEKLPR